jgi:hypothetical protein
MQRPLSHIKIRRTHRAILICRNACRRDWRQLFNVIMARQTVKNQWFVSVEAPKQLRLASPKTPARQTKTFPTETEAKQFAKEMLSNKYRDRCGYIAER